MQLKPSSLFHTEARAITHTGPINWLEGVLGLEKTLQQSGRLELGESVSYCVCKNTSHLAHMFVSVLGRLKYENHGSTDKLDYREA